MSTSVHGSLGPSGHTRSKQKRLGDLVERERERRARPLSFSYFVVCYYNSLFFELMSDFSFFFWQSKRKLDPKKGKSQSSGEDVVWFFLHSYFLSFVLHPLL